MREGKSAASSSWSIIHSLIFVGLLAGILLIAWLLPSTRVVAWLSVMALTAFLGVVIGHGISGYWLGVLTDASHKISLSRLQMMFWTLLVLSAFLTAVATNIALQVSEPLQITIPVELWVLMGISATSMVGVPLIQSAKSRKKPEEANPRVNPAFGNAASVVPSIADIFREGDANNGKSVSLSHVQMFFFTIILLFGYGATIAGLFSSGEPITAFPEIDGGMLALLSISHASFLVNKAIA